MSELTRNLLAIQQWIESSPDPSSFASEDDFMTFLVAAMGRALYLFRAGVSLAPNTFIATHGHIKRHAVVVGHMVRLTKLFEGFYLHIAKRQVELAGIMLRLIYETEARLEYLITKAGRHSYKSFVLASYRAAKESLVDLDGKAKTRQLTPIEKRIRRSILKSLRQDRISRKELLQNRTWDIDGKNARSILNDLGRTTEYSYLFGASSQWVHGNWRELSFYHLKKRGGRFLPDLNFTAPDTRITAPATALCLSVLLRYLQWSKSDSGHVLSGLVQRLLTLIISVDDEHEERLISGGLL